MAADRHAQSRALSKRPDRAGGIRFDSARVWLMARCSAAAPHCIVRRLEAEARLQIDGARAQGRLCLAEFAAGDRVLNTVWVEVDAVEDVEGIGAQFELGILAEDRHLGQAEGLGESGVEVAIVRTVERVASHAGRLRRRIRGGERRGGGCKRGSGEVSLRTVGIVPIGTTGLEGGVAGVVACAAEIGCRTQYRVRAAAVVELAGNAIEL